MIDRLLPVGVTKRLQVANILLGICGLMVAFFLPTGRAVLVINLVSMWTLVTAGVAGLDSARNPSTDDGPGEAETPPIPLGQLAVADMVLRDGEKVGAIVYRTGRAR